LSSCILQITTITVKSDHGIRQTRNLIKSRLNFWSNRVTAV